MRSCRDRLSAKLLRRYDETPVYRDGKWLMLDLANDGLFDDVTVLLSVKRKPAAR